MFRQCIHLINTQRFSLLDEWMCQSFFEHSVKIFIFGSLLLRNNNYKMLDWFFETFAGAENWLFSLHFQKSVFHFFLFFQRGRRLNWLDSFFNDFNAIGTPTFTSLNRLFYVFVAGPTFDDPIRLYAWDGDTFRLEVVAVAAAVATSFRLLFPHTQRISTEAAAPFLLNHYTLFTHIDHSVEISIRIATNMVQATANHDKSGQGHLRMASFSIQYECIFRKEGCTIYFISWPRNCHIFTT